MAASFSPAKGRDPRSLIDNPNAHSPAVERGDAGPGFGDVTKDFTEEQRRLFGIAQTASKVAGGDVAIELMHGVDDVYGAVEDE